MARTKKVVDSKAQLKGKRPLCRLCLVGHNATLDLNLAHAHCPIRDKKAWIQIPTTSGQCDTFEPLLVKVAA